MDFPHREGNRPTSGQSLTVRHALPAGLAGSVEKTESDVGRQDDRGKHSRMARSRRYCGLTSATARPHELKGAGGDFTSTWVIRYLILHCV